MAFYFSIYWNGLKITRRKYLQYQNLQFDNAALFCLLIGVVCGKNRKSKPNSNSERKRIDSSEDASSIDVKPFGISQMAILCVCDYDDKQTIHFIMASVIN